MSATSCQDQVLMEWAASDLSFQIGMAVKRALVRAAIQRAAAREDKLVCVADIKNAFAVVNWQDILQMAEGAVHGRNESRTFLTA